MFQILVYSQMSVQHAIICVCLTHSLGPGEHIYEAANPTTFVLTISGFVQCCIFVCSDQPLLIAQHFSVLISH